MWKNTCFLFSCIHWKSKCHPNKYRVKIEHESLQNVIYKASFFFTTFIDISVFLVFFFFFPKYSVLVFFLRKIFGWWSNSKARSVSLITRDLRTCRLKLIILLGYSVSGSLPQPRSRQSERRWHSSRTE